MLGPKATASGPTKSTGDFFSTGRRRAVGFAVMETVDADIGWREMGEKN